MEFAFTEQVYAVLLIRPVTLMGELLPVEDLDSEPEVQVAV